MAVPNFFTGSKTGITTSAVALSSTDLHAHRGVQIVAATGNANPIYIGQSASVTADSAEATDGYPLSAGESIVIPVIDPNTVYVVSAAGTGKAFYVSV
tara:strand:+ start:179 stop:472 length:294 start_codon:yes stop_codon:yes gene_type:complete